MDIYLLRHGTTVVPGTYTGIRDVLLSETGSREVKKLAPAVAALPLEHCFCSTLTRCRQSLDLLGLTCDCTFDTELVEIDFGRWEGLSFDQISRSDPEQMQSWFEQGDAFTFPGGENISTFNKRVSGWFDRLLESGYAAVLVISHAGVIRHGLCRLLGMQSDDGFRFEIKEASLSLVSHTDGSGRLVQLNCRSC